MPSPLPSTSHGPPPTPPAPVLPPLPHVPPSLPPAPACPLLALHVPPSHAPLFTPPALPCPLPSHVPPFTPPVPLPVPSSLPATMSLCQGLSCPSVPHSWVLCLSEEFSLTPPGPSPCMRVQVPSPPTLLQITPANGTCPSGTARLTLLPVRASWASLLRAPCGYRIFVACAFVCVCACAPPAPVWSPAPRLVCSPVEAVELCVCEQQATGFRLYVLHRKEVCRTEGDAL